MVGPEVTFYDLLGVEPSATGEEIKSAWRKIAKETHPDRHKENPELTERFKQCSKAAEVLLDVETRVRYDAELQAPSIADFVGAWVQSHKQELHKRAQQPLPSKPRRKKKTAAVPPSSPSSYASEQQRLEKEFGWTADPANYDSMMGKDPTREYDTPLDGLTSDDLLQALLSEAVLKAAMREDSRMKVNGNKVEVKLAPDLTVTIDSNTVKNLRKVHRNLRQMERLVDGVKRWWSG